LKKKKKTRYPAFMHLSNKKTKGYIRPEAEREVKVHSGAGSPRTVRKPKRVLARRAGQASSFQPSMTKFNIRNRKIIYAAIRIGLPISRCYSLIGVSQVIFNGWMEYGKDPRYKQFHNFRRKIKKIEKERELEALKVIQACGKGGITITKTKVKIGPKGTESERTTSTLAPQWTAAAWFLERTAKEVYGKDMPVFTKTPDEYAREIKEASDMLLSSVPSGDD